jgi:hypothetical protein
MPIPESTVPLIRRPAPLPPPHPTPTQEGRNAQEKEPRSLPDTTPGGLRAQPSGTSVSLSHPPPGDSGALIQTPLPPGGTTNENDRRLGTIDVGGRRHGMTDGGG